MPAILRCSTYQPFTFPAVGHEVWCDLAVYRLADGRDVCIATERADNPGASITNASELAATWAAFLLHLPSEAIVWIEHYAPASGLRDKEHCWDRVEFTIEKSNGSGAFPALAWRFAHPQWRPMQIEDWNDLGIRPEGVA